MVSKLQKNTVFVSWSIPPKYNVLDWSGNIIWKLEGIVAFKSHLPSNIRWTPRLSEHGTLWGLCRPDSASNWSRVDAIRVTPALFNITLFRFWLGFDKLEALGCPQRSPLYSYLQPSTSISTRNLPSPSYQHSPKLMYQEKSQITSISPRALWNFCHEEPRNDTSCRGTAPHFSICRNTVRVTGSRSARQTSIIPTQLGIYVLFLGRSPQVKTSVLALGCHWLGGRPNSISRYVWVISERPNWSFHLLQD